jgi:hypothetical protein
MVFGLDFDQTLRYNLARHELNYSKHEIYENSKENKKKMNSKQLY